MSNSIILLSSTLQDLDILIDSIKDKYIIYNSGILEDNVLKEINEQTTRLAFMFHYNLSCNIPFFINKSFINESFINDSFINKSFINESFINDSLINNTKYLYYSTRFIQFLENCLKINPNLTFDILSCNFNNPLFITETNKIKSLLNCNIEYSLDKTGNLDGNWILESNNINIRDYYFNDNIQNWNHTLLLIQQYSGFNDGDFSINDFFMTYFDNCSVSYNTNIYTLNTINANNIITLKTGSPYLALFDNTGKQTSIILLMDNETFDGSNITIDLNGIESNGILFSGLFSTQGTVICNNLQITNSNVINNINLDNDGTYGASVFITYTQNNTYTTINNCSITCNIINENTPSSSGGFIGSGCQCNISINNCFIIGNISLINSEYSGGGFIGAQCNYITSNNININNCYINGDINIYICNLGGGGFIGSLCCFQDGNITLTNCYINSQNIFIESITSGGGGFIGPSCCLLNSSILLNNCYIDAFILIIITNIGGINGGGLIGSYCSYDTGNIIINNCYLVGNTLNVVNSFSGGGGFIGSNCSVINNNIIINSCYISYLNQISSGAFFGGNTSGIINFCYYPTNINITPASNNSNIVYKYYDGVNKDYLTDYNTLTNGVGFNAITYQSGINYDPNWFSTGFWVPKVNDFPILMQYNSINDNILPLIPVSAITNMNSISNISNTLIFNTTLIDTITINNYYGVFISNINYLGYSSLENINYQVYSNITNVNNVIFLYNNANVLYDIITLNNIIIDNNAKTITITRNFTISNNTIIIIPSFYTFDGNNFTITIPTINTSLFSGQYITIKNLKVYYIYYLDNDPDFDNKDDVFNTCSIFPENTIGVNFKDIKSNIQFSGNNSTEIKIYHCKCIYNIYNNYYGGYIGNRSNEIKIYDSYFKGVVKGKYSTGFIGYKSKNLKLVNNVFNGKLIDQSEMSNKPFVGIESINVFEKNNNYK